MQEFKCILDVQPMHVIAIVLQGISLRRHFNCDEIDYGFDLHVAFAHCQASQCLHMCCMPQNLLVIVG